MSWISVNERLPEVGRDVRVKGLYTPAGTGYPLARLNPPDRRDFGPWDSTEWRGTAGITHWLEERTKNARSKEKTG